MSAEDRVKLTEKGEMMLNALERGCGCRAPCSMPVDGGLCAYWIAKDEGPLELQVCKQCKDLKGRPVQTLHGTKGCIRCAGRKV